MYSGQTRRSVVVNEDGIDNVGESNGNQGTVSGSDGFVDIHVRSSQRDNLHTIEQHMQSNVDEQLRQRIRELEATVHRQNAEILGKEILRRNNNAAINTIVKIKAVNEVLQEDRENYHRVMQFYQRQAEVETTKNNMYKERIQESNMRLLTNERDTNKRIKDLEQEVIYWKQKFENTCILENQNQSSSQVYKPTADTSVGTVPKRRRHSFLQSRTNLPTCRNCMTVFDKKKPYEIECRFHRSFPQPLKAWKNQLSETQFDNLSMPGYKFWPCCEKVGLNEPPGCLKLRTHDIIMLDEE